MRRQRVFDCLTANIDRNSGNLLVDPAWNLVLIDHSRAFATDRMPFEKELTRIDRSLFDRLSMERMCSSADVERAVTEPPEGTRAYFRGKCLQKWPNDIVAANWDSMVFDVGRDPLRRVPMMEPLRGTAAHVARLIEESTTAADLLERLGA